MNIFVKMSSEVEMKSMTDKFKAIDKDGTGMITAVEMKDFITKSCDDKMSEQEIKDIVFELDSYGNGLINYTEFLAATVDVKTFFNEGKLKSVFSMFDTNSTGNISEENMCNAFQKLGLMVPKEEIHEIML